MEESGTRFDPIDIELLLVRSRLSPGQRLQTMLDAREVLVGLIRGRLRRQYPEMSATEINLKVLREIERAKQIRPRS